MPRAKADTNLYVGDSVLNAPAAEVSGEQSLRFQGTIGERMCKCARASCPEHSRSSKEQRHRSQTQTLHRACHYELVSSKQRSYTKRVRVHKPLLATIASIDVMWGSDGDRARSRGFIGGASPSTCRYTCWHSGVRYTTLAYGALTARHWETGLWLGKRRYRCRRRKPFQWVVDATTRPVNRISTLIVHYKKFLMRRSFVNGEIDGAMRACL